MPGSEIEMASLQMGPIMMPDAAAAAAIKPMLEALDTVVNTDAGATIIRVFWTADDDGKAETISKTVADFLAGAVANSLTPRRANESLFLASTVRICVNNVTRVEASDALLIGGSSSIVIG
jgi:hypothetical protein